MRPPTDSYECSTHTNAQNTFKKKCTAHHISTKAVRAVVLETIKAAQALVETDEAEFIRQVRESSEIRQEESVKACRKKLAKAQKRVSELNGLFRKIYEDNANGKLSDKRFELLAADYEAEQAELEKTIAETQSMIDSYAADSTRADRFIELAKKYRDFSELTGTMINEFIEKIIVYEAQTIDHERVQDVDIYLNFIGKFELPPQELSEEEEKELLKLKQRRESQRRYNAKVREKRKQAREEAA